METFILVYVTVVEDTILENIEMFTGGLRSPSSTNIILDPATASATILDDDNVLIGFLSDYEVTEGVNNTVTIELAVLLGTLGRDIEVSVSTLDGSAEGEYVCVMPDRVLMTALLQLGFRRMCQMRMLFWFL